MGNRFVSTFPSTDRAFKRVVEHVGAQAGSASPEDLAKRLRPLFPKVKVFEQHLQGEPARIYVFRDGRYELERAAGWWREPDVASVCLSVESGRLTSVSPAYAELIRASTDDLIGRHYSDFLLPEAREAAKALFESLAEDREVTTEALIQRVDGSTLRIELHASRSDGEIDVRYRAVA